MASYMARSTSLCVIGLLNFAFVFITGLDFISFVSFQAIYQNITGETKLCQDTIPWSIALQDNTVLRSIAVDMVLLCLFTVQHSVLAWAPVKKACQSVFGVLNRALYCSSTALVLQVLMRFWQPIIGTPCFWSVRNEPWSTWFPLICFTLHFLCWAIICSILLIFDYPELLGIKQVYYECLGLGDPLLLKSPRAQRLFCHLRHPVFLELGVVLWFVPTLSVDRLLLAGSLSVYLAMAHSLDKQDLAYLSVQLNSKLRLFCQPQGGALQEDNNQTQM